MVIKTFRCQDCNHLFDRKVPAGEGAEFQSCPNCRSRNIARNCRSVISKKKGATGSG